MRTSVRFMLAGIISLLLGGCASSYKTFYKQQPDVAPETISVWRVNPPPAVPMLERTASNNVDAILATYAKRGYQLIGYSIFNSGANETEASALEQGKEVGADLVLVANPRYTGSTTSTIPIVVPTTTTSYTTGSATAFGNGGSVTAYGNARTTTNGSQTTYIPVTTHRLDYGAGYFVKRRPGLLGTLVRDLNDSERQALQTNQGVVVTVTVDDTPAFNADILPGDVILSIDGIAVPNRNGFSRMAPQMNGKLVSITLVRNSQRIEKRVQLNTL
jgi:hypothetical protein